MQMMSKRTWMYVSLISHSFSLIRTYPFSQIDFEIEIVINDGNSVFGELDVALDHIGAVVAGLDHRFDRVLAKLLLVIRVRIA